MIRFSCPGCSATYTVGDEKGGKSGRCPKCQSQFTIPMPDASTSVPASTPSAPTLPPTPSAPKLPPVPPPPPPPPAAGPVEIAPCPGCQAKLSVERTDLGSDVECPYCKTVFKAKLPGSGGSGTTGGGSTRRPKRQDEDEDVLSGIPRGAALRGDDDDDRPSRRSRTRDEDDEDERPSRRSRRRDEDEEEERPRRRRPADEDEEERPRRKRKRSGRGVEPHRGVMILVFGLLGFCCVIFAILAVLFAQQDLRKMADGEMDDSGQGLTQAGRILGIIWLILTVIGVAFRIVGMALR